MSTSTPLSLNQKGFAPLAVVLILIAGILVGLYLVQHPQILKPKATEIKSSRPPSFKPRLGDLNEDGKVNISDFNILLSQFGKSGNKLKADLNQDGHVDTSDFNLLFQNFDGYRPSETATPAPSASAVIIPSSTPVLKSPLPKESTLPVQSPTLAPTSTPSPLNLNPGQSRIFSQNGVQVLWNICLPSRLPTIGLVWPGLGTKDQNFYVSRTDLSGDNSRVQLGQTNDQFITDISSPKNHQIKYEVYQTADNTGSPIGDATLVTQDCK